MKFSVAEVNAALKQRGVKCVCGADACFEHWVTKDPEVCAEFAKVNRRFGPWSNKEFADAIAGDCEND